MRLVLMLGCAAVATAASAQRAAEVAPPEPAGQSSRGDADRAGTGAQAQPTLPPVAGQAPRPSPDNHNAMKGDHQPAAAPGNPNARNPDPR